MPPFGNCIHLFPRISWNLCYVTLRRMVFFFFFNLVFFFFLVTLRRSNFFFKFLRLTPLFPHWYWINGIQVYFFFFWFEKNLIKTTSRQDKRISCLTISSSKIIKKWWKFFLFENSLKKFFSRQFCKNPWEREIEKNIWNSLYQI